MGKKYELQEICTYVEKKVREADGRIFFRLEPMVCFL